MPDYIIEAEHLTKKFTLDAGFFAKNDRFVYAVNDVSLGIERGKNLRPGRRVRLRQNNHRPHAYKNVQG